MKLPHKYILTLVSLLLLCNMLQATKALPKLQNFVNPNGTSVTIQVMGDHIFGYKQTLDGKIVEIGEDGYLYYAILTPNGKETTSQRVIPGNNANTGRISPQTIRAIREYNLLQMPPHSRPANLSRGTKGAAQTVKYPVLLVEFEDVKFTAKNPKESFNAMLNTPGYNIGGATGSAADYLNANFNGYRKFSFAVSDVITLPVSIAQYGAQAGTKNDTSPMQLLIDACAAAEEQGFDLSSADHNNNGELENIAIIFAGHSESEGGSPNSIWPHQMNISEQNIYCNGLKINSYSCSAELKGAQGSELAAIGTFCHEFLHSLGLPDLYDTNGEEEGLSPALYGSLSIMDAGNFLNNGNTPPNLCAIERELLGMGMVENLLPDKSYTILPVASSEKIYRIPAAKQGEYFLVECREASGWDKYIGGSGMVVYHVDMSGSIYGGMESSMRWKFNNINTFAEHECARLLPAMGKGCGIEGVFFPGQGKIDKLLSSNTPSLLKEWDGYAVGIGITDIKFTDGKTSFKTIRDYSHNSSLPTVKELKVYPMQKDVYLEWESSGNASPWIIEWKKEKEELFKTSITDKTEHSIKGLEPGCKYDISIRSFNSMEYGVPLYEQFATLEISSPYPFIFLGEMGRKSRGKMDMRVFNLPEDATSVTWYINGMQTSANYIIPEEYKELEIEVEIRYTDASSEKIYKKIKLD